MSDDRWRWNFTATTLDKDPCPLCGIRLTPGEDVAVEDRPPMPTRVWHVRCAQRTERIR